MKKNHLICFFLLALNSALIGQDVTTPMTNLALLNSNISQAARSNTLLSFNDRYDGIEGNRFFYDDKYHDGEIWFTDKRHFTTEYKYKFDQLAGTVQILKNDGKEILLDVKDVATFQLFIEDKIVTFARTNLPNTNQPCLVQVIYATPKYKLVRDAKKRLVRRENTGAYADGKVYDLIKNDYQYYLAKNDDPLAEIKPTKKGFIKALPEKEAAIEKIFKLKAFKDDLTITKLAEVMQRLEAKE